MKEVLIGITMGLENGMQRLRHAYVEAVEEAGATPVLLPAVRREAALQALLQTVDGLIVGGGPAVTDGLIGALPGDLAEADPERAEFDKRVTSAFLTSTKPVLGICYGMQLLNALDGGTIYADAERQIGGALAHSEKRGANVHPITIARDSTLFELLGTAQTTVNTRHVQAIASLGSSFRVSAVAPDGVVEAIERDGGRILGVQFHPEMMGEPMRPLFRHLVERARCGE